MEIRCTAYRRVFAPIWLGIGASPLHLRIPSANKCQSPTRYHHALEPLHPGSPRPAFGRSVPTSLVSFQDDLGRARSNSGRRSRKRGAWQCKPMPSWFYPLVISLRITAAPISFVFASHSEIIVDSETERARSERRVIDDRRRLSSLIFVEIWVAI